MTDRELKTLKDNLWHAADVLRSGAHLAANKYGQPILGLIFLRYADILFKQHKDDIDAEHTKRLGTRMEKTSKEIAVEKCGFFLPECAYYDFINDAPDTAEKADLVKKAMEEAGEDFRMLILPDHPTPIRIRTHNGDPVPYLLYDSTRQEKKIASFSEAEARAAGVYQPDGYKLIDELLK